MLLIKCETCGYMYTCEGSYDPETNAIEADNGACPKCNEQENLTAEEIYESETD